MSILGLPVVLAVLSLAAPAQRAPLPEEQKAFAEGLRLFDSGDARGAEAAWKGGYAVRRDPAFLVRIGEAEEKAGAPTEAVKTYERYLHESPDAADRADIEGRVRRLAPAPRPTDKPTADGEIPGDLAAPASQTPGPPVPGSAASTPAAPVAPVSSAPRGIQALDSSGDGDEDLRPVMEDEGPRSKLNTAGWIGAGVTALLFGVAAFYGASAADKSGDANRLLLYFNQQTGVPQEYATHAKQFEDDVRLGQRDDRIAKGLAIAGGLTALASAVLFIVDAKTATEKNGPAVRVGVGKNGSTTGRPTLTARGATTGPTTVPRWGLSWTF